LKGTIRPLFLHQTTPRPFTMKSSFAKSEGRRGNAHQEDQKGRAATKIGDHADTTVKVISEGAKPWGKGEKANAKKRDCLGNDVRKEKQVRSQEKKSGAWKKEARKKKTTRWDVCRTRGGGSFVQEEERVGETKGGGRVQFGGARAGGWGGFWIEKVFFFSKKPKNSQVKCSWHTYPLGGQVARRLQICVGGRPNPKEAGTGTDKGKGRVAVK